MEETLSPVPQVREEGRLKGLLSVGHRLTGNSKQAACDFHEEARVCLAYVTCELSGQPHQGTRDLAPVSESRGLELSFLFKATCQDGYQGTSELVLVPANTKDRTPPWWVFWKSENTHLIGHTRTLATASVGSWEIPIFRRVATYLLKLRVLLLGTRRRGDGDVARDTATYPASVSS